MENEGSYGGPIRRTSRQMSQAIPETVRLEGRDIQPARVEGNCDVYRAPKFVLVKSRWIADTEVSTCWACGAKFNQLRRKHHCRLCGLVFCAKCCKEKVPLPQLACEEPERVCELCRPVAELVSKSRSTHLPFQLDSAKGLAHASRDPPKILKVVELGGIQALVTLSLIDSVHIRRHVTAGLHVLSTHQQLHTVLAQAGAIKAVCKILASVGDTEEDTLCDGISALMFFCKSPELKTKALEDGALGPVLSVCMQHRPAPALLALMTLSHIAESPATHDAIVDSPKQALQRILSLTASEDEQMQEVSLKILAHLSNGNDRNRHRIVQEDFSSGHSLHKALASNPKSQQVLCNAACLVANLATSANDQVSDSRQHHSLLSNLQAFHLQGGLQEVMELTGCLLQAGSSNRELLIHLVRGLANFAAYKQNAQRLITFVPAVVSSCLRSGVANARAYALRFLLSLLSHLPEQTSELLIRDGAQEVLRQLGSMPELLEVMRTSLGAEVPDRVKPM